jgi:uncharacterized surface protein with fasciclin (FAS1) repeats
LEDLLKPENKKKLASILTYHVVAGEMPAGKVVKSDGATTVQGQRLEFKVDGKKVLVELMVRRCSSTKRKWSRPTSSAAMA